jgi:hypothetical protein
MVLFGHHQDGEDPVVPTDNVQTYQHYAMTNTRLDGESFAVRFLAYLSALSSGSESEKALLQFAYHGPLSLDLGMAHGPENRISAHTWAGPFGPFGPF